MSKPTKYYLRLTDDAEDSIYTPDTVAGAHASMKITKAELAQMKRATGMKQGIPQQIMRAFLTHAMRYEI